MSPPAIQYHLLSGFDDSLISPDLWNKLLEGSSVDEIFLTWHWQKTWWEVFGKGKLLLILVMRDGKPLVIAPLYSDSGMIFFVGSGGSDYLDFVGDINDSDILEKILLLAVRHVTDFVGFRFYHVQNTSGISATLAEVAQRQKWELYEEGELISPRLDIKGFPERMDEAINKKSLVRHENWFKKNGTIEVNHVSKNENILPYLDQFFEQHVLRWEQTVFPSLFKEDIHKQFYKRFCELASETDWLRFTIVFWKSGAIAFHYGFNYKKKFLWYKPSFDFTLAKHSPGEVLLRHLLVLAIKEGTEIFDFGIGDEEFKKRFSTNSLFVKTWGLYPQSSINAD